MRNRLILASVVVALVSACESKNATLGPDSGGTDDVAVIDGGTTGTIDGGTVDAGATVDLGSTDAGARADVGTTAGDVGVRDATTTASDGAVAACMARDLGSALGTAVATGNTDTGTTSFAGGCGGDEAPESALTWTAPAAGAYTFSTEGTDFDTVLYVNDGACDGTELDCNDDSPDANGDLWSAVTVTLRSGQRVAVFVDGYGSKSGDWTLNINAGGAADSGVPSDVPSDVPSATTDASVDVSTDASTDASIDASIDVPPG